MLRITDNIDDMGLPQWDLALCLLLAWILIYLCLVRGIKSSGKAVYFTAIFPYLVLIVLLGRAVTLDGAMKGIKFYVTPKWELLASASVSCYFLSKFYIGMKHLFHGCHMSFAIPFVGYLSLIM